MKHATLELLAKLSIEPNSLNIECKEQIARFELLSELSGNSTPHYVGVLALVAQYPLPDRKVAAPADDYYEDGEVVDEEVDSMFDGSDAPNELVDGPPKNVKSRKKAKELQPA
jgi:hypothetical protein